MAHTILVTMVPRSLRLISSLVLAGWLFPVTLPLLCSSAVRRATAECEQGNASGTAQRAVTTVSHQVACSSSGMCGGPVTAVPTAPVTPLAAVAELPAGFGVLRLPPGDSPAPLSPPPQA